MESWINKQAHESISRFDIVMDELYPTSKEYSKNPKLFIKHIKEKTNYFEAVEMMDWKKIIPKSSSILDLGCGIGWVSAYLSQFRNVKKIFCVDSSKYYVDKMLPLIFDHLDGDKQKIKTIEGLFYPIILNNNSIDIVVICASLHHSDNMESLLKEINRILKYDGKLIILNENPHSYIRYILMCIKFFIKVFYNILLKRYNSTNQSLNYANILTDPDLGDRAYPEWSIIKMLKLCGFKKVSKIDSGFSHNKTSTILQHNSNLIHFICEK